MRGPPTVKDHPQMKGNYTLTARSIDMTRVKDHPQMKGNYTPET